MSKTNYLVINCGYTSRLIKHVDKMIIKPIFIYDPIWNKYNDTEPMIQFEGCEYEDIKKVVNGCKEKNLSYEGTIVFKYQQGVNIVNLVKSLQKYQHCGFFFIDDRYGNSMLEDCTKEEYEKEYDIKLTDEEFKEKRLKFENMREIKDLDLDHFVRKNEEYYYGTLYEVEIIQKDDYKITYLEFDTESG
jgi:hypothetical protein